MYEGRAAYVRHQSPIFRDVDYDYVFWRLMYRDYASLAAKLVWLGPEGPEYPRTHPREVEAWLRARVRAFSEEELRRHYPREMADSVRAEDLYGFEAEAKEDVPAAAADAKAAPGTLPGKAVSAETLVEEALPPAEVLAAARARVTVAA
jgi:hypothetical protein